MNADDSVPEPAIQSQSVRIIVRLLTIVQLLLIPVCIVVALMLGSDLTIRQRIKLMIIAWALFSSFTVLPIAIVTAFQRFFGFILGPPRFRTRWLTLQSSAWMATVGFYLVGFAFFRYVVGKELIDALVFAAPAAAFASIGFYLLAMSGMPPEFFVEDRIGAAIFKFVGAKTPNGAVWRCRWSFAALFGIAVYLVWLPYDTFG